MIVPCRKCRLPGCRALEPRWTNCFAPRSSLQWAYPSYLVQWSRTPTCYLRITQDPNITTFHLATKAVANRKMSQFGSGDFMLEAQLACLRRQ